MSKQDEINEQLEEQIEIIEQEEVQESTPNATIEKLKNWYKHQNKALVLGIGGLFILILVWFAFKYFYQTPREKRAEIAIYKTQALFDVDSFGLVLKTASKLAKDYSGTKSGNIAAYMAGSSYLYKGDFKNAIKYLSDVSFDDRIMKAQAIGLLGDAYVENNEIDKGLSQYLKAAKSAETEYAIQWYKKAAIIYQNKKEWKEALDIYRTLKNEYFDAEKIQDIDKYISRAEQEAGE